MNTATVTQGTNNKGGNEMKLGDMKIWDGVPGLGTGYQGQYIEPELLGNEPSPGFYDLCEETDYNRYGAPSVLMLVHNIHPKGLESSWNNVIRKHIGTACVYRDSMGRLRVKKVRK